MNTLGWLLFFLAFAFGSIPFGVIVARLFKVKDLQSRGSGNIGATNVSRVLGFWPAGLIVFLLDGLKGVLGAALGSQFGQALSQSFQGNGWAGNWDFSNLPSSSGWWFGLAAVIGHCFTPWLKFKGGKGVATGFGALLVLSPIAACGGLIVFGLSFGMTRIGSLGSLAGILATAWLHVTLHSVGPELFAGALIVAVILLRHEENITALLAARENRF